jgi:hypothetical protein
MDQPDDLLCVAECIEMARGAKTDIERQKLLQIARAWRGLAESGSSCMPPPSEKKELADS